MKRYRMKVDISQQPIVDALRSLGDKVDIIGRPVDLLIRSHSIYWTAEVKTPGKNSKRRTKAQIDHYEDAARHNAPHCLLLSVEEAVHARNRIISRLI